MISIERSLFITRPADEVWDFLANPANNAQWQGSTEASEWTSEGPPGVGSTQHSVTRFLGRKIEATSEVTIWDPPYQQGSKLVSGPIPFETDMTLESQDNGTQITMTFQAEVGGFFKIAEGLAGKQAEKQIDTDLGALKLLLEAG